MAASGWLLAVSSIRILTRIEPSFFHLGAFLHPLPLGQLAAGLAFSFALKAAGRSSSPFAFPGVLAGGGVLVHLALFATGTPIAVARSEGWLLQIQSAAVVPAIWLSSRLDSIHPFVLVRLAGDFAALIVVTAITLLLSITSIEVEAGLDTDVDVDRELRLNGIANLIAALPGGMAGTLSLSRTLFNFQNGGTGRTSGLTTAVTSLVVLLFGASALGYVPVPLIGGMLVQLGAVMLDDWVIKGWRRMPLADFAQAAGILIIILVSGFLAGVAAGVVAACVTFAVTSSRIRLVKLALDRSKTSSRVDRPPSQNQELIRNGSGIQIFRLHGFVFFGSANRLLMHLKDIVSAQKPGTCRVLVLDFHEVLGIDSSAVLSLMKLRIFARRENFLIAFSGLPESVERGLREGGLFASVADSPAVAIFPDQDAALEWAEDRLLEDLRSREEAIRSTDEWLEREIGSRELFREFASYLEMVEYQVGDTLFQQGDSGDSLVLLHSGRVSVVFKAPDGRELRLRSMIQQTIVGEMGLYRARPRGASVRVERPTVVYRLSSEALEQIERDNPTLAYAFHKFVIRTLADRVDFANREVSALQQ
jgi:SulP family sulfate permease